MIVELIIKLFFIRQIYKRKSSLNSFIIASGEIVIEKRIAAIGVVSFHSALVARYVLKFSMLEWRTWLIMVLMEVWWSMIV